MEQPGEDHVHEAARRERVDTEAAPPLRLPTLGAGERRQPRERVGVLLEARYTQFTAELNSAINTEFTTARAPLPALGVVGRGYVLPNLAINFEVTGFRLPEFDKRYEATYFDWDINGTVNVTNNVGLQVGWRKLTNFLRIENDLGDLRFQGLWFGAAVRY